MPPMAASLQWEYLIPCVQRASEILSALKSQDHKHPLGEFCLVTAMRHLVTNVCMALDRESVFCFITSLCSRPKSSSCNLIACEFWPCRAVLMNSLVNHKANKGIEGFLRARCYLVLRAYKSSNINH